MIDEVDFKLHVKREEFEELCSGLFDRVRAPIDSALISAGMDITALDQVRKEFKLCPYLFCLF